VQIALAKGRKLYDKRNLLMSRDLEREAARHKEINHWSGPEWCVKLTEKNPRMNSWPPGQLEIPHGVIASTPVVDVGEASRGLGATLKSRNQNKRRAQLALAA